MISMVARSLRFAVIAFALASTGIVLFPGQAEPLWDWTNDVSQNLTFRERLPAFGTAQQLAAKSLLGVILAGLVYNVVRDRRYRALVCEYEYRTDASNLRKQNTTLTKQLEDANHRIAKLISDAGSERVAFYDKESVLKEQIAALRADVAAHQVRVQHGVQAQQNLQTLRPQFEALLAQCGHAAGIVDGLKVLMGLPPGTNLTGTTVVQVPSKKALEYEGPKDDMA